MRCTHWIIKKCSTKGDERIILSVAFVAFVRRHLPKPCRTQENRKLQLWSSNTGQMAELQHGGARAAEPRGLFTI